MKYEVYQGRRIMEIDLPDIWEVTEVPDIEKKPVTNIENLILSRLKNPSNSRPLSEIVRPGQQIAICVTDVSRPTPDHILLPPILKELEDAGIDRNNITIIIANGSHRPVTLTEIKDKYGYYASENYRFINHSSTDGNSLTDLGPTSTGAPRVVNSILTMVDHIISTGVIELHQYAGYSGGAKTIAVGCAGEETIQHTHSARFLEKSGAVPGRIEGNLFQQTLWETVEPLPFSFSMNVILNEQREILSLDAGSPSSVYFGLIRENRDLFEYTANDTFDIAYMGVPFPKDMNLYQATRSATYQALSGRPVFRPRAILNLFCSCPEGTGDGVGERRFRDVLMKMSSAEELMEQMLNGNNLPGEQRAYMVARTLKNYGINILGTAIPHQDLLSMGFLSQPMIPDFLQRRKCRALVLKDGMKKIVKLRS